MKISADNIDSIDIGECPEGYSLRGIQSGDEENLAKLLASAGVGQSAWDDFDTPGMIKYLDSPEKWQGTRVIEYQGEICAACFATPNHPWGQLDYVCVHPEHRGQNLAYNVCAAVMHYFRNQGYEGVSLSTIPILPDNHQLAAIKTYLMLGFLPVRTDEIAEICQEIYVELGWPLPIKWWK